MPTLTESQLQEVIARTGKGIDAAGFGSGGVNIKLPTGEVIPAGFEPHNAPTIVLGGGVIERAGTPSGPTPGATPMAPTIPTANFPAGVPAPFETKTGAVAKPIPNSGSDSFQGTINGKIKTFTSKEAAQAAGALNIQPIPSGGTTPPAPPGTVSGVGGLIGNTQIDALEKKYTDLASQISAGISAGGAEQILEGLFKRFGVEGETTLLNDYNKQILETQQRLRKIPEDIKVTLANVGVSENQLNRLVVKETQKPLETLRDLMEQKGAAQDRINQALKFVGLFADAQMQDRAAKIEALRFDFETNKFLIGRLDEKQKETLKLALEEQKRKLGLIDDITKGGATEAERKDAFNLDSEALIKKYGNYLADKKITTEFRDVGGRQVQYILDKDKNIIGVKDLGPSTSEGGNKPLTANELRDRLALFGLSVTDVPVNASLNDLVTVFAKIHTPREWSDKELKQGITERKDDVSGKLTEDEKSYEGIKEFILNESAIENKARAIEILDESFGKNRKSLFDRLFFGGALETTQRPTTPPLIIPIEGGRPITLETMYEADANIPSPFVYR